MFSVEKKTLEEVTSKEELKTLQIGQYVKVCTVYVEGIITNIDNQRGEFTVSRNANEGWAIVNNKWFGKQEWDDETGPVPETTLFRYEKK